MDFYVTGSERLERAPGFKLVGRAEKLREISYILMRSKADSILLVGAGGVGLSTILLGLQASKNHDDASFDIISKRLYWLDVDRLFGIGEDQKVKDAFNQMMMVMDRTPESVLIIENTKVFLEGAKNAGCLSFLNTLTTAVRGGKTQIIWECRDEDLEYALKTYPELHEFYTLVDVREPDAADLKEIVFHATESLRAHHQIKIAPEAIIEAVNLTTKYRGTNGGLSRAQPERSITLLDRALASYRLDAHRGKTTEDLRKLHGEVREAEEFIIRRDAEIAEKDAAVRDPKEEKKFRGLAERIGGSTDTADLRRQRDNAEAVLTVLRKQYERATQKINDDLALTKDMVQQEFSRISGIPMSTLNEDEREKLLTMETHLNDAVFDQQEAVKAVTNAAKVARIGRRTGGPLGCFMLGGPSGVGKTELVRQFSAHRALNLDRLDMSEFMEKHDVAKLIGAPPGYEGFEEGGRLTTSVRNNPNQVFLFDEVEKANIKVFDVLLQVLDAARLTDNLGREVSFKESYIFMTTNIGQEYLLDEKIPFPEAKAMALADLRKIFRAEFLNRINGMQNILWFERLAPPTIAKIIRREINALDSAYEGINSVMTDEDLMAFVIDRYEVRTGARGPVGYVRANLDPIIADQLLAAPDFTGTLRIGYDKKSRKFTTSMKRKAA